MHGATTKVFAYFFKAYVDLWLAPVLSEFWTYLSKHPTNRCYAPIRPEASHFLGFWIMLRDIW